jgi:polar amino acid transport system permease protein
LGTFDWSVIWRYRDVIVSGLGVTLEIASVTLIVGTLIGIPVAYARMSKVRVLRFAASAYVELVRGVPLLLVILFVYFALPSIGPRFSELHSAIFAISIYAGTYMSEIIRAGISAVGTGQTEASKALGLSSFQTARSVVLPQALRIALPSIGNQFISLVKDSSLAAAISVAELTYAAQFISLQTFRVFEAFLSIGAIYLIVTALLAAGLRSLERRLAFHG